MSLDERIRSLRRDFDGAFERPPLAAGDAQEDFLALGLAGEPYAIPLEEVAALAARPRVTPLPSRRPECLGLVGHAGAPLALFSLAALLGVPGGGAPRWMAVLRGAPDLALGFERYDGYARADEILPLGDDARRPHARRAARHGGLTRLVIDIPSILKRLNG